MKQYLISVRTEGQCESGHPQHNVGWRITNEDGNVLENTSIPEQDKLTQSEIFELLQCLSVGTQAILDWHGHILKEIDSGCITQSVVCE